MIDISKYEGHTEGPWRIAFWDGQWYVDDEDDYTVCRLDGTAQKQDPTAKLIAAAPDLLKEVKRLLDKEADVIEYVTPLLATPDVLKQLMGSPSQIHTIVNLTASLEHLLYILRNGENE